MDAGKSKTKVPVDLVSGEDFHPGLEPATFLLCSHMIEGGRGKRVGEEEGEGGRKYSFLSLLKDTNPIRSGCHA